MKRVTELAPAKLNLYLKVLGKRADGYHDIETLFERIGIFDKITAREASRGVEIKCTDSSVPTGRGSLCYRAVEVLKKRFRIKKGVKIRIDKRIPVAAGLGGGSSDAASILKALTRLWSLKPDNKELMDTAAPLGADVPFFLADSSFAIGRERGDDIIPIASGKKFWHLVVTPNLPLLSGDIYRLYGESHSLALTGTKSVDRILSPSLDLSDISRLNKLLHNDLEGIVLSREPFIRDIRNMLREKSGGSTLVSGSGPSVFGLYGTRKEALRAGKRLKGFPDYQRWRMFIAKTY